MFLAVEVGLIPKDGRAKPEPLAQSVTDDIFDALEGALADSYLILSEPESKWKSIEVTITPVEVPDTYGRQ